MYLYHLRIITSCGEMHKIGISGGFINRMKNYQSMPLVFNIVKTRKLEDALVLESEIKSAFPPCFGSEYFKLDADEDYARFNLMFWSGSSDAVEDIKIDNLTLANRDEHIRRYMIQHDEFSILCRHVEYNGGIMTKRRAQYSNIIRTKKDDGVSGSIADELSKLILPDTQYTKEQLFDLTTQVDTSIAKDESLIYNLNNILCKLNKVIVPSTYKVCTGAVSGHKDNYYYKIIKYSSPRNKLLQQLRYSKSIALAINKHSELQNDDSKSGIQYFYIT